MATDTTPQLAVVDGESHDQFRKELADFLTDWRQDTARVEEKIDWLLAAINRQPRVQVRIAPISTDGQHAIIRDFLEEAIMQVANPDATITRDELHRMYLRYHYHWLQREVLAGRMTEAEAQELYGSRYTPSKFTRTLRAWIDRGQLTGVDSTTSHGGRAWGGLRAKPWVQEMLATSVETYVLPPKERT
jgi:hypothetical protein